MTDETTRIMGIALFCGCLGFMLAVVVFPTATKRGIIDCERRVVDNIQFNRSAYRLDSGSDRENLGHALYEAVCHRMVRGT